MARIIHQFPLPKMEPAIDEWDFVIKVKHGDTLRRFGARVCGNSVDHSMNQLREKVQNLFRLSSDDDLVFTYIDVDGDLVTLVTDDELRDAAISQHLSPLRINVQVKSNSIGTSETKHTASFPSDSSSPLKQTNLAVAEALRSVPEPLCNVVSQLSQEFASKANAAAPLINDFVEYFAKLGQSHFGPSTSVAGQSGTFTSAFNHLSDPKVGNSTGASIDLVSELTEFPKANVDDRTLECNSKLPDSGKVAGSLEARASQSDASSHIDQQTPICPLDELLVSLQTTSNKEGHVKEVVCQPTMTPSSASVLFPLHISSKQQNFERNNSVKSSSCDGLSATLDQSNSKQFPRDIGFEAQFKSNSGTDSGDRRKIGSSIPSNSPAAMFSPAGFPLTSFSDNYSGLPRTFHRGIRCNGCGMHPIMGPRYKSIVKEDYDLCSICFLEMDSDSGFTRIDHPMNQCGRPFRRNVAPHPMSYTSRGHAMRSSGAKLESRFVRDVTVLDGTRISPSLPFTKIWRMQNSGSTPWPVGTQLVWIGGDQLTDRKSVELEIPVNGILANAEIDVAVDFVAPSSPGRYTSYWRMASPSGKKFGQRVWVLIQVDGSRPTFGSKSPNSGLNLNLPPESSGWNGSMLIDVNAVPLEDASPSPCDFSDVDVDLIRLSVDESLGKNVGPSSVDNLSDVMVVKDEFVDAVSEMTSATSNPIDDSGLIPTYTQQEMVPEDVLPADTSLPVTSCLGPVVALSGAGSQDNVIEQSLLKELEGIGFKNEELNKEVLKENDYDLVRSVDCLCGASDWTLFLEELKEMGFCDTATNIKLLIKNGGSFTQVVLDLIAEEKDE